MSVEAMSDKCRFLSLMAMITVVFIHSNTIGTFPEASSWNMFMQNLLTRQMSSWAVPFFFCLSGYWFARGGGGGYRALLGKKLKGLLVPYFCWAAIGAVVSLPAFVVNNHMNQVPLLSRTFLSSGDALTILNRLVGLTSLGPSGNMALWYVRSLLVMFLFAPLWWVLLRKKRAVLAVAALGFVLFCGDFMIPYLSVRCGSFGWFLLGSCTVGLAERKRMVPYWLSICFGLAYVGLAAFGSLGYSISGNLVPIFGILFFWTSYDYFNSSIIARHSPLLNVPTFWVYCLHGPLMGYFLAGIPFVCGKSDVSTFLTMLVSPPLAIGVCLSAAMLCRHWLPRVYALLTGGR